MEYTQVKKQKSHAKWVIPLFLGAIGLGTYHYMSQLESDDVPEVAYEDKSEEMAMWLDKEFDMATNLAVGKMPSIDMIQRGVNFFNGDNFDTRPRAGAWQYTYTDGKQFSEPFNWKVPDQVIGTPAVSIECATQNGVSEVFSSNSMQQVETTAHDIKTGYERKVDVNAGVSVPAGPATATAGAKTTLTTSLQYGNSRVERDSKQSLQEGYKYSLSNQARAKIFEIEIDGYAQTNPQFQAFYKTITNDATAHNFVKMFGTHWIEKAQFGASFDKAIFISTDNDVESASSFKKQVHNGGFEMMGFGASAKHTKTKMKNAVKQSKVKKIKIVNFSKGSIDFRALEACASMGSINAPVMVDQQIRPYHVLPDLMLYPQQTQKLQAFTSKVIKAANKCRAVHCGNKGDCKPNKVAWGLWTNFKNFDEYFLQNSNECLEVSMFEEQRKKDDAAEAAQRKKAKHQQYKEDHCVEAWEHPNFAGSHFKWCLDIHHTLNQIDIPNFSSFGFNDKMSAIKVGKHVTANVFQNLINGGFRWAIYGPYKGTEGFSHDQATSLSIVKKEASACLWEHAYGGKQQCFPHGQGANVVRRYPNLHPLEMGDLVTTLMVPAGVQVKLFEHTNFIGGVDVYTGPNKWHAIHNDWYSSMMVCKGACP